MSQNEFLPPLSGYSYSGSGNPGQPMFRDQLDARRSMWNRTPEAEYPDGLLTNIPSRRGDRLMGALKYKLGARAYDRGVHKGVRIDPRDYDWPDDWNPMTGLLAEARGKRTAPVEPIAPYATGRVPFLRGNTTGPQVQALNQQIGQRRADQLARYKPPWSM